MNPPEIEVVETDLLILGGGMAGCGAAYEAGYWARTQGLRTTLVEKAAVERSGAVAMGLSAINCYMGMQWGENQPEDFVRYVRQDLMGICREDLVYDIARHVDECVHLFEKWGLPIFKNEDGHYKREGRWQIMIHGESYKPIVAEAAKRAIGPENVYERIFVSHLLKDPGSGRVSGAVGFSAREHKAYVFKAQAVIVAAGGATGVFRPHAVGEGLGRIWYAPWNTGSAYSLPIQAGATMTQMEHRLVVTRFKDGYGPVGMWFLLFKGKVRNAYGELYEETQAAALDDFPPYGNARPIPTPLRNHQMLLDRAQGKGPHYMRTDEALQALTKGLDPKAVREIESDAWEDFLDMTMSQALLWASYNIDPAQLPSELDLTEPYLMGSHSSGTGAWVSGPEDLAPEGYFWGYNRMTTVPGLFAAGDGVGGSAHKFSSGSYAEGRLAAKGAIAYIVDSHQRPEVDDGQADAMVDSLFAPYRVLEDSQGESTRAEVSPNYFFPKQGLLRLQKLMEEYAGGLSSNLMVNEPMLLRGLELMEMLKQDMDRVAARDRHDLLRCWELRDRIWCAEAHMRHLLHRKETRWPGYYYRGDYPQLDDENWRVFVNSSYDAATAQWTVGTAPYHSIVP
ncbi:MAG: adenylyl-sulfate reductase subunit alpha [Actinomycetota bacterium]|nr:adenylyl-sulfate reductase subunit alpha [Actinomycetota bacterium]